MQFMRGFLFGLIVSVGLTVFLAGTDPGRAYWSQTTGAVAGWFGGGADAARDAAGDLDLGGLAEQAGDAAESVAAAVSEADLDDVAEQVSEAAGSAAEAAAETAGEVAVRARQLAYQAAEEFPAIAALGDNLHGWQQQLLDYETQLEAERAEQSDVAAAEAELDEMFRAPTRAAPIVTPPEAAPEPTPEADADAAESPPPEASPAPSMVSFAAHPMFYKCPVIEVSNSGPVGDDRQLLDYTPWVDTPAGVLIRAPVEAACLSSGYGARMVDGGSREHAGVDYYNREGGVIYAAGDGVVTQAGEDGAYGQSVRIDHGGGVESHYAHMVPGSLQVSEGDEVTLGEPIGQMGHSGRAYAVHLHYELRFAEDTVDPLEVGPKATF